MPKELPRDVTFLSRKDLGFGNVARLVRDGRLYWHARPIHREEDGTERMWDADHKYAKDDYLLLEGKQFDLVERVNRARREHEQSRENRDRARERAKWEALDKFDKDHPYPTLPKLETLIPGLLREQLAAERR